MAGWRCESMGYFLSVVGVVRGFASLVRRHSRSDCQAASLTASLTIGCGSSSNWCSRCEGGSAETMTRRSEPGDDQLDPKLGAVNRVVHQGEPRRLSHVRGRRTRRRDRDCVTHPGGTTHGGAIDVRSSMTY